LFLPFATWVAFSVCAVAASVWGFLAVRRIPPAGEEDTSEWKPIELRLFMSGVLRPPAFATAVLILPIVLLNYYEPQNSRLVSWLTNDVLTAYGPNPWTDAGFVVAKAGLVVALAFVVVKADTAYRPMRPDLIAHVNRLLFIGGTLLAIITVVLPALEWNASLLAGRGFGMSGLDVAFVAVIVLAIVIRLEGSSRREAATPLLTSPVP
jgi:hypothetical protein